MTKRILGIVIVLCMMLTFVPFVGSAATVEGGYLMIDNNKAASGDGWNWENGVLTLSQGEEINSVMLSVEAEVVLTEDVVFGGMFILASGGSINTGEYTLTVYGGINGMTIDISDSNLVAGSVMATETLSINNSAVNVDCTGMAYAIGVYSNVLEVNNSVLTVAAGIQGDLTSNGIYVGQASFVNSVVAVKGSGMGIVTSESSNDYTGVLEITNSTVYSEGILTAIAGSLSYQGNMDIGAVVYNDATLKTPANGVIDIGSYYDGYNSATYTGIFDELGEIARVVEFEATDVDVLPNGGEIPELPELPEGGDAPSEPEEPLYSVGVYGEVIGTEIYISVFAENTHDRVALYAADDTANSSAIVVSDDYVEYEEYGLREWVLVIDIPAEETEFVIKCRDEETKSYKNGRIFESITIKPASTIPYIEELYVGGVNALETPEGDGWYYDADTLTLTLDNCTLTQTGTYVNAYDEVINAVIYACGDLNIEFIGDNFIENRVEEIPEVATTYGAIWIDGTYNDYAGDTLSISGQGNLTVGLAVSQDVYKTGLVEFSFAMYVYNEYGVDLTGLESETTVDIYGGVVGVPAIYNVRPFASGPSFANGNKVTAYKNIEGTMLNENGFDPDNNEAWRLVIETTSAGVDKDGVLNIFDTSAAYGDGWSWEDCVLTIGGEPDFNAIWFELEDADAKIVLSQDTVIDTRAKTPEDAWTLLPSISFMSYSGSLEIDTGDYNLTILNDRGFVIESYGTLIIAGNLTIDNYDNGYSAITVTGDLIINDSVITAESGGIDVFSSYDYENEVDIYGNVVITNSEVNVSGCYVDNMGYEVSSYGIDAYCDITIENSDINVSGSISGLSANNIYIKSSNVTAYGMVTGIEAFYTLTIDSCTISSESQSAAISVCPIWDWLEGVAGGITLLGVNVINSEDAVIGIGNAIDEYGYEYQTNTFVDADGNALSSVYLEASNSAEYEIINGKLIITVVTENRINRVALYDADGKCIKTFNTYEVDENGNFVWTIKMDAPTEETQYVIKGRDAEANSYKKGFTLPTLKIEPEVVFESVTVETRGDKVYVIATTVSDNYDRVAVVNPIDGSYVKYTRNYKVVDGKYVWTIFFDYVEGMDNLIVKARDIRNNRYNNAQAVDITVDAPVEPVIDVEMEVYDEDRVIVRVTTVPDLYRVKIAYADNPTGYIAYAKNPVEKTEEAWVWEMIIDYPAGDTEYAIDIAYEKAYARYFTYVDFFVA